jgi:TusA-related sulfurtransferase
MEMHVIDANGKLCPIPMIMVNKKLQSMSAGDIIELHSDDCDLVREIETFCKYTSNTLKASYTMGEGGNRYVFDIVKN